MKKNNAVTIYTTNQHYGNIVRFQGELRDCGCQPRRGVPAAAYVRFVPTGKVRERVILQVTDPYILVTEGLDGILTHNMFPVTATLTGLTVQRGPVCSDPHYLDHFDRLITTLIDSGRLRVVADFRRPLPYAPHWAHTAALPSQKLPVYERRG